MSRGASWREFLVEDEAGIADLVRSMKRVAVLGIKTEAAASQPAFYVARYLVDAGLDMIPVPVYYPDAVRILDRQVYRRVADVPPPIDCVDVFRRSGDVRAHVPDLLLAKPHAVWLQLGIRNDTAAEELARTGIRVVQDRCLMVDHRRYARAPH